MAITLKSAAEIEKMRIVGRLAADVLKMIEPHVVPGVTTDRLDEICHDYIVNTQQAIPAPLNYRGFPKTCYTDYFSDTEGFYLETSFYFRSGPHRFCCLHHWRHLDRKDYEPFS